MPRRTLTLAAALAMFAVAAAPAQALIWAPAGELLPDGLSRPIIESATLETPAPHNALLEADLDIDHATDVGVSYYEYRWNRGAAAGGVHRTDVVTPTVSYASIQPESLYDLEVRAIDRRGWVSDWAPVWSGTTPSVPTIVVAGDSVASGYQRQWFTRSSTCRDEGYSYGSAATDAISASLPAAWQPTYRNIAWPGAGVGDVLDGGSDSCSTSYPSQVDQIADYADPGSWNVVVLTAGINSTNWVDVITGLTRDTALSLTESGDKRACQAAVATKWNLDDRQAAITDTASAIVRELGERTNARVLWTSYYDLSGTRLAPLWTPVGTECAEEMDQALGRLHQTLLDGIDGRAEWIDLTSAPVATQRWAGWPHPDVDGHTVIGAEVAAAVTG